MIVKVTPVFYREKDSKRRREGIEILNRKTNTYTLIDANLLRPVNGPYDEYIRLTDSVGNVYFNFN